MISKVVNSFFQMSPPRWMSGTLITIAVLLFCAAQFSINAVNGWWMDELYSLWASDTSIPFRVAFSERIYPDTNPPTYYSLLYLARLVEGDDRATILLLNFFFLAAAVGSVIFVSRKARMPELAAIGISLFILSGPVLVYAAEARVYLAALAVAFVTAWYVALAIDEPDSQPSLGVFIGLGALGALTHVYAALFCGCLAAGLLALAIWDPRRRDLLGPALALGLSTTVIFVIWLLSIRAALDRADWLEFTSKTLMTAFWYVKVVTVGPRLLLLFMAVLLSAGLLTRERDRL